MKKFLCAPCLLLALTWPTMGQADEPVVSVLDEVVVTAARVEEPASAVSAAITIIDSEEVALSPARTVGELLTAKGIGSVKHYPGALTAVDIRGFKSESYGTDLKSHVLILLDGRRAGTGNIAKITTANVDRIEIIRGPGSVQYGSAAMGGVINVITRRGSGAPTAAVGASVGSHGHGEGRLAIAGTERQIDFAGAFSRSSMDDYDTGSGDHFANTGTDRLDSYSINAGYTFAPTDRLGLTFTRSDGSGIGSPGYLSSNDLDNFKNAANHSADLVYDGESRDGRLGWRLRAFDGRDRDSWHDPLISNASGWDDGITDWNETDFSGVQAQTTLALGPFRLTGGIDWLAYDTASSMEPARSDYDNMAFFVLAQAKMLEDRVIINGGLRHDGYKVEVVQPEGRTEKDSNQTASLGIVYLPASSWKIRANYGEAFIMPAAGELAADFVSDFGIHYLGNPQLAPESSRTWEGAVEYDNPASGLRAGLGYFHTRFRDKIESVWGAGGRTWQNVGKARIAGFEGEVSWDLGARFGWTHEVRPFCSFVYLDQFDDLDRNEELSYISDLNASAGLAVGDHDRLSGRLTFTHRGEQTIEDWESGLFPAPVISSGGFVVADLTASARIIEFATRGSLTLTGAITNIFDRDYAWVKGYPMPGRMVYAGVTWSY
ncbi:MAG: TonB-dependent receptor plug domain-containing protein [Thermodesulfobacteriota bacterium]